MMYTISLHNVEIKHESATGTKGQHYQCVTTVLALDIDGIGFEVRDERHYTNTYGDEQRRVLQLIPNAFYPGTVINDRHWQGETVSQLFDDMVLDWLNEIHTETPIATRQVDWLPMEITVMVARLRVAETVERSAA